MRRIATVVLGLLVAAPVARAASPEPAAEPAPPPTETPAAAPAPSTSTGSEESVTPLGALWRSSLVPGWGQRYKGETRKGWWLTGGAIGLGTASAAGFANMKIAEDAYFGETSPDADYRALYDRYTNATILFDGLALATAGVWIYGVGDSAFKPLEHLRIKDARVKDVFPGISNHYQTSPLALVEVTNRSSEPVERVKVKLEAKGIMDVPAESEVVDKIPPGFAQAFQVKAAFNKNVMNVGASEPQAVAAKITLEYEVGRKKKSVTRTATFTVYNRNAITWDDMRKMAAWVTPRDPAVKELVSLVTGKRIKLAATAGRPERVVGATSFTAAKSLSQAAAYFDALGALNINYVSDPQAPFQLFEGNAASVDYIGYPHETLGRRSGDCDDLSALYASLLESAGIPAALVDVPGHVYVMFDSGLSPDEAKVYESETLQFHVEDGTAWVPVEITAVGKPFKDAWALASVETRKWSGQGKLRLVPVLQAQTEFPPSPPDHPPVELAKHLSSAVFAKLFAADLSLAHKEEAEREKRVAKIRAKDIPDAMKANQIGIVYARDGQLPEAEAHFREAITGDPTLFKGYNNLANVLYLQGKNQEAIRTYEKAIAVGGETAPVLLNLATIHLEIGDLANAGAVFERAARLEPVYEREYPELAAIAREGGEQLAAATSASPSGKAAGIGAGERDPRRSRWTP